ncbi:hypothetical protein BGZ83_009375 [Gryganskiella cystojenkinii]|nr:hypothetical protein BGZ83_009375 [Gryganskiella cystojenkinii]
MFDLSPKNVLSGPDTMDLVETLLKNAHESEKPTTKHAFCNHAETYLRSMKKFVRRPSPSTNSSSGIAKTDSNDDDKVLQQRIARAYRDHANLVADQNPKPGATKNIALQVKKAAPVTIVATVSANIFPVDYRPFSTAWLFPGPDERVEDTPQLVSCLGLLKQASVDLPEDALDTVARKWLRATAQNSDEKTRLETLATDVVRAFTKDEIKDDKAIAEVLCLAPVLNSSDFRFLLDLLVNSLKENTHTLLDFGALRGVAQMLRSATPDHQLSSQDLIDILVPISKKLQDTHEGSPKQIFELTVAVSSVLDAMADARVTGLKRVVLHEPLLAFLGSLRKNDDPHLEFYASYAFQALLCIPNDESSWQATVRRTTAIVKGVSGLVSAVKSLDLTAFMTGLQTIQQGFEGAQQVWELGKSAIEGIKDVFESEQDVVDSLKETFTLNRRRAWYSALRGADTLLNGGELTQFKILVCGATCRLDVEFQWGICQRLGAVAANPRWGIEVRQGAVRFLEEIYRNDSVWELHKPIKALILDILKRLSVGSTKLPGTYWTNVYILLRYIL